jgi:predicted nucleic acid-binding protein
VRVVLDTTILVRAGASPHGLVRDLLLAIITAKHPLILSNEMLYELAKVLRYPRVMAIYGLQETQISNSCGRLPNAVSVSAFGVAGITLVTVMVLGLALLISLLDRRFSEQLKVRGPRIRVNHRWKFGRCLVFWRWQ